MAEFNAELYLENLETELFSDEESVTEKYLDFITFDEYMQEGFNYDIDQQHAEDLKEISKAMKSIKKDIGKKNFDSAKETIKKLDKKVDDAISNLKKQEGGVSEAVFGFIYYQFRTLVHMFLWGLVTLPIGGIGAFITKIDAMLNAVYGTYKKIHGKIKNKEEITPDDFNVFKNMVLSKYLNIKASLKTLDTKVDMEKRKAEADKKSEDKPEDKKDDEVKESVDNQFIIDCLEFAMNFDDDSDDDASMFEGFNLDLNKEYKQNIKEVKMLLKSAKQNIKVKDYGRAKEDLAKLDKKIDKNIESLNEVEGTITDAMFGYILRSFFATAKVLVASIVTLPVLGVGGIAMAIAETITDIYGLVTKISGKIKNNEEITPDDFNLFKNSLLAKYKNFKAVIKQLNQKIEKLEKEEKASKESEVKEKVDDIFEQEKLKLYEACSAGEITEDQRENLISRFKNISKVEESVLVNNINDDYSIRDKFEAVKKDLYERCANGEFSVDVREDLVKEAYTRFFEGEEGVDQVIANAKKKSTLDQESKKLIADTNKVADINATT